jgi:hypothetical protein
MSKKKIQRGQAMSEFALVMPLLVLLFFGIFLAGFYAWRAGAADVGVFLSGAAEGAYISPAGAQVAESILWADIRGGLEYGPGEDRQVRSSISISNSRSWMGIDLRETQRGSATFRLWRFYPGPPDGEIE